MIGIWGTMMAMKLAAGALALMVGMGAVQSAEANRGAAAAAARTLAVERTIATNTSAFVDSDNGYMLSKEVTHTITVERETIVRISASSEKADLVLVLTMSNGTTVDNDDFDGLNPQIVARVPAGTHQVRLGLFPYTLDTDGAFPVKFTVAQGTEEELAAAESAASGEDRAPTLRGGPTGTIARGRAIEQTVKFSSAHPMGELGCVNAEEPSYTVSVPRGLAGTLSIAVPVTDELSDPMFIAFRADGSYEWDDDGGEALDSLENISVQGGEVFYIFVGSPTCAHGAGQTKLKISLN